MDKNGWAVWNKGTARTREMLLVIWGGRNGISSQAVTLGQS